MFLIIARLIKAYSTVLFCNVLRIYLLSDDLLTLRIDFWSHRRYCFERFDCKTNKGYFTITSVVSAKIHLSFYLFEKSLGTLYYAGDWIPVRESSVKAPDKLGLFTVIVASNELCYHTNCSRWFYVFFWSMKPHGQLQFNETQLLGSVFLDKSCLLCCVRSTIMTQNEDTSVKKKLFLSQCCLISLDIAKNWLYLFSNFELSRKREFSHF